MAELGSDRFPVKGTLAVPDFQMLKN